MPLLNGARVVVVRSDPFYGGRSSIRNLGACLALAVALRKHPSLGATTIYFSEGEERWSTSLGLIFKQLRTLAR